MTPQRVFVSTAFLALVSALVGLGALAAGASNLFGSLNAGERIAFQAAAVLGFLTGGALLFQSMRRAEVLGPTASAVGALVAALAFSMPAVQAFAADTNTPEDDTSGCGSISTPYKQTLPPGATTPPVQTDTCRDRLRKQKALVLALSLPTLAATGVGLTLGMRAERRVRPSDYAGATSPARSRP